MKKQTLLIAATTLGLLTLLWLVLPALLPDDAARFSLRAGPPPPPPPQMTLNATPISSGSNTYRFNLTDPPTVSGKDASLRIFLNHGDGTFFLGSMADLASHQHEYSNRLTVYESYAEAIPLYDDDENPVQRSTSTNVGTSGFPSTVNHPQADLSQKPILLQRTCDAVADNLITYVVTYGLSSGNVSHGPGCSSPLSVEGFVRFRFDSTHLDYQETKSYFPDNTGDYEAPVQQIASGTFKVPFQRLDEGEQRNLFFVLKTKSTATDTNYALIPPIAEIVYNGSCVVNSEYRDTIHGQKIRDSHDPNQKTVWSNNWYPDGTITWRIDFQNEGNAPEDSVSVVDWIDTVFALKSVQVVGGSFPVTKFHRDPVQRKFTFVLDSIDLRGLGERGVDLEETRGYLLLRAKLRKPEPCDVPVNYARIHFGCKPPIYTEPGFARLPCSDLIDSCLALFDTLLPTRVISPGQNMFAGSELNSATQAVLSQAATDKHLRWYPADGLSSPFVVNPVVNSPLARRYVLIATFPDTCGRMVIQVPVEPPGKPSLAVTTTPNNCPYPSKRSVKATAGGVDLKYLLWHDCTTGSLPWEKKDQDIPQTIYVGVWDTLTGCSAEEWIVLDPNCPPGGGCSGQSTAGLAAMAAAVLALVFVVFRFLKKR